MGTAFHCKAARETERCHSNSPLKCARPFNNEPADRWPLKMSKRACSTSCSRCTSTSAPSDLNFWVAELVRVLRFLKSHDFSYPPIKNGRGTSNFNPSSPTSHSTPPTPTPRKASRWERPVGTIPRCRFTTTTTLTGRSHEDATRRCHSGELPVRQRIGQQGSTGGRLASHSDSGPL